MGLARDNHPHVLFMRVLSGLTPLVQLTRAGLIRYISKDADLIFIRK